MISCLLLNTKTTASSPFLTYYGNIFHLIFCLRLIFKDVSHSHEKLKTEQSIEIIER